MCCCAWKVSITSCSCSTHYHKRFEGTIWTVQNSGHGFELCFLAYNRVGRNVAAGMTGGLAYILDEDETFVPKVRFDSPL